MKTTTKGNSTSAPSIQEELNKKFNTYISIQKNISSYLSSQQLQNYLKARYQMNMILQMNAIKMYQVYQMYLAQNKILRPEIKLDKNSPSYIPSSIVEGAPEPPKCEIINEQPQIEQNIIDINALCEYSNTNPDSINNSQEENKENIEIENKSMPVIVDNVPKKKEKIYYICNLCQRKFKTQNAFNSHMNTHNFQCGYCNKLYSEKRILEQHINENHSNSYVCSIDKKKFKTASALENHTRAKHQKGKGLNQHNKKLNDENKRAKVKIDDESIIQVALRK